MRLALLAVLCASCVTSPWDASAGCRPISPAGFEGWSVYSCAHPFARRPSAEPVACSRATFEASAATGPLLPCGWTRGFTDRATRTVKVWEVYEDETLAHELLHVRGRIRGDR